MSDPNLCEKIAQPVRALSLYYVIITISMISKLLIFWLYLSLQLGTIKCSTATNLDHKDSLKSPQRVKPSSTGPSSN